MQLEVLEPVNLDADVVEDALAVHPFQQFVRLEVVRCARHDVHLDAAACGAHQSLDDDGVLVPLVLDEQGVPTCEYAKGVDGINTLNRMADGLSVAVKSTDVARARHCGGRRCGCGVRRRHGLRP